MSQNNVAQDIFAGGAAVSSGIASYYQGKSQAQLAKSNPKAFLQYKKQQNKIGLILTFTFLGIFLVIVIIIIVVAVINSKNDSKAFDEEVEKNKNQLQ